MEARLNRRKARRRLLRFLGLGVGGSLLGVLLWQAFFVPPPAPPEQAAVTATTRPTEPFEQARPANAIRITPPPTSQLTLGTPADAWADAVMAIAFPEINDAPAALDGLAWWQSRDVNGVLGLDETDVVVGTRPVDASSAGTLLVRVPDPRDPRQLTTVGEAQINDAMLNLSTNPLQSPFTVQRWVVSDGTIQLALQALARSAEESSLEIVAAYAPNDTQPAELAIVALERTDALLPTRTATGTRQPTLTPYPTRTLTPTPEPTPTREPDAYLSRLVAGAVDSFVAHEPQITSNSVYEFAFGHPRTGTLTWTELGGRVGGREMALGDANELTIYALVPEDTNGSTERLFRAVYDGSATRIPQEQVYFQGLRMGEIVYWMVRRAFEQGGQLVIVYDDFGTRQTITLIGFEPLNTPTIP